jgi:hypothetical protein
MRSSRTVCVGQRSPEWATGLLATALLLQTYDGVSDERPKNGDFDMRWKVALGVAMDERPLQEHSATVSSATHSAR